MRTSYSALETFQQCPQKYKFQEIEKIKTPKSKEAVFGTLIHSTLRYMFTPNPLYPSLDEIISSFRAGWNVAGVQGLSQEEHAMYLSQGETLLQRFYAKNQPWNYNVVDLETRFEITLDDPGTGKTHIVAGIMDRVDKPGDTAYEIIDYKTSRKMKSQEAVDNDFQLSLYHLGLTRRWPHIDPATISLSLYYVKHNEKLTTVRLPAQTEATKEHLRVVIRDIEQRVETDDFPPQPSVLCDWCGYKNRCPAWKFLFADDKSQNTKRSDIEMIIREFFKLKKTSQETAKRIAELQSDIKTYMDQEGLTRVFGNEGTIAKSVQERYQYDFEKIKQMLHEHNRLDIWETVLAPDDKKFKKVLAEFPSPLKEKLLEARSVAKKFEVLTTTIKKNIKSSMGLEEEV